MMDNHFRRNPSLHMNAATWLAASIFALAVLALPQTAMAQTNTRWAWGDDFNGQLGDNKPANYQWIPVAITATTNNLTSADDISAGYAHSLALKSDGTVWTWGWNHYGQLGTGGAIPGSDSNVPAKIVGLTGMTAVAAGGYHSLALKNDGTVKAWGHNNYGQLGNGVTLPGSDSSSPVTVSSLTNVKAIAAGGYHSLALKNDGTVWAWGFGLDGELGNGLHTTSSTPVKVSFPAGTVITAIAAGLYHSLAIKNDGTVWAWGRNVNGQLGDGSTAQRNSPVQVHVITGIVAIAGGGSDDTQTYVGGSHSLALKSDGSVWAWGYNANGQLGDGTFQDSDVPVEVLTGAKGIAAGGWHSMAISSSNGTVAAWGLNNWGQLGNGTLSTYGVPAMVSNITGMTHIAAGGYHSLAISCTAPAAPTLDSATGDCSGVNLAWTAPTTGCTSSYNVYRSTNTTCPVGTLTKIATAVTTTSYADTSAVAGTAYTYVVRGCCDLYGTNESSNSNCLAATRTAVPAVPAAPGVADVDPCALSGVSITWSDVTGAAGYDLRVDSATTVTGVTSPYTYSPGNSNLHNYQVRSKNTCGSSSWSTGTAGTDAVCAVPPETSAGTSGASTAMTWSEDKLTIGWQAVSGIVSGYRLYKGVPADLPNLLSASTDSCTRYDGALLSYTLNTTTDMPTDGNFYWFLVDAYNGAGEGSAGNATAGARIVSSSGSCP